jgi:hypothetical protein
MPEDAYDPYADGDDFEDEGDDEFDGSDEEEEDGEEGEEDGEAKPAVFVTTAQAVAIRVDRLTDERAPDGSALATYIDDRLVARSAMDIESIERLLALGLFDQPVPLGLFAYEETPGLQCRLFALVPTSALREASHADEPWKASVPSFEDREEEDNSGPSMETILLGHIVRFETDRKHPDDLAAEAVDVLQKILTGGPLSDANQKAIDDLLNSL